MLVLSSGCPPCRDRAFQWLSSVPCSCRSNAAFWNTMQISEFAWSLLETCLTSVCVAAAYQARPARDEDVQVILVGFQGDGNERSRHPSQYIHTPTHTHTHTHTHTVQNEVLSIYSSLLQAHLKNRCENSVCCCVESA